MELSVRVKQVNSLKSHKFMVENKELEQVNWYWLIKMSLKEEDLHI